MGYRWYDSRQLEVAFPFGDGLSYTEFEIGLPSVTIGQTVIVEAEVRNIGDRKGVEVVQLYACVLPTRPWPLTNMSSMSAPACGPKPPTTSQHPIQENPNVIRETKALVATVGESLETQETIAPGRLKPRPAVR